MSVAARLYGPYEGTHDLAVNLWSNRVYVDVLACEKLAGIVDVVNAGRFESDLVETSGRQLAPIVVLFQRSSNTANPKQKAPAYLRHHLATRDDIGDREATSRFEYPERFSQNRVLVSREIDDAIRDDDINGFVRQRDVFNLAPQELDVFNPSFRLFSFANANISSVMSNP